MRRRQFEGRRKSLSGQGTPGEGPKAQPPLSGQVGGMPEWKYGHSLRRHFLHRLRWGGPSDTGSGTDLQHRRAMPRDPRSGRAASTGPKAQAGFPKVASPIPEPESYHPIFKTSGFERLKPSKHGPGESPRTAGASPFKMKNTKGFEARCIVLVGPELGLLRDPSPP